MLHWKLVAPGVIGIIDNNRSLVEPLTDIAEHTFEINNEVEGEIGNEEQGVDIENESEQLPDISSANIDFRSTQSTLDDLISNYIRNLNNMQRQVFDVIYK